MFAEQIKVTGQVSIVITGKDGQVKDQREIKNLVVTTGKEFIAARMVGTPTAMSHMALGSNNTAADAGDTAAATALAREATRALDKAASKGVIHKNQAANRKSSISKRAEAL
jgi:hypothetical protein